jgi:hypothetical protein
MSDFDPSVFLDATITEVQVKRPPLPAGADFIGTVGEPKFRQNQGKQDPTKVYTSVDIPILLDTSLVEGQPKTLTLNYGFLLEITEQGTIDTGPGKNSKLRLLREALGMNTFGTPFNFRAAQGRTVRAKIGHREYNGEVYDEVVAVSKA